MTLFEAQPYDPVAARKRRVRITAIAVIVLVCLILAWNFRYYPQEHLVDTFFAALQQQSYEKAYGIWNHDPEWKQHPEKYANYSFPEFMKDWGPGGQWGLIKSYHVDGSAVPKGGNGTKFDVSSSGVVVVVTVNERVADKAHIWVEKSDKTLGFSPY
ncbi:MAG TPA: hypothetical protein VE779_05155 [Candidatus Angelobacter sp.]|nr:hypothetical protein [Candidatus Angelobacter sp.]